MANTYSRENSRYVIVEAEAFAVFVSDFRATVGGFERR
jgi:hypothetical protein